MRPRHLAELVALAALWGASFLFMRIAAPAFGPVPLIEVRVAAAAASLLPLLAWRGGLGALRGHLGAIATLGVLNSAVPFSLLAFATLALPAGVASVLNATAPLFGAVVSALWLGERPTRLRIAGLAAGFGGVVLLVAQRASFGGSAAGGVLPAVAAALTATLLYGIAANYARQRVAGVDPFAVAAVSLVAAALFLLPAAVVNWPAVTPPPSAWLAASALAVLCTGLAYVLYYRLIAAVGAAKAIAVTFLVPVFGLTWGGIFLGEEITAAMLGAIGVVFVGTKLATS